MMEAPLVSVIIPAYNAEPYIDQALAAVVGQTYRPLEVVVADDGSTDGTARRVENWKTSGVSIRWIEAGEHSGRPSVPRNRALQAARGELIAFLDADDIWAPRKLEDQVRAMQAYPDLVLVYSVLRTIGAQTIVAPVFGLKPWPTRAALDRNTLERANTIPCSSVMTRRALLLRLGGFDEDPQLHAVEDFDLWLRVSERGPIGFIPRVHGYYRVHQTGISRNAEDQLRRAQYLVHKRGLKNFTFREFQRRPRILTVMRNTLDICMTCALNIREFIDRRWRVDVRLRTAPADGHTN
jgi:glycosyltransferase involved in cell wall biosynthesis